MEIYSLGFTSPRSCTFAFKESQEQIDNVENIKNKPAKRKQVYFSKAELCWKQQAIKQQLQQNLKLPANKLGTMSHKHCI